MALCVYSGSYHKESTVDLRIVDNKLQIWQCFGDYMIAEHTISLGKGQLVKSSDHKRDKEGSIDVLHEKILSRLGNHWESYLLEIRKRKVRYYRDQLSLLKKLLREYDSSVLEEAHIYCLEHELYSIHDFKSACKHLASNISIKTSEPLITPKIQLINNPDVMNVITQKRDLNEYASVGGEILE